jgi:Zn-dependent peptidase ImmA (M78 family)
LIPADATRGAPTTEVLEGLARQFKVSTLVVLRRLYDAQLMNRGEYQELFAQSAKRIKIPNACLGLNVRYVTPFTMLRAEKARFILPQPALRAA